MARRTAEAMSRNSMIGPRSYPGWSSIAARDLRSAVRPIERERNQKREAAEQPDKRQRTPRFRQRSEERRVGKARRPKTDGANRRNESRSQEPRSGEWGGGV